MNQCFSDSEYIWVAYRSMLIKRSNLYGYQTKCEDKKRVRKSSCTNQLGKRVTTKSRNITGLPSTCMLLVHGRVGWGQTTFLVVINDPRNDNVGWHLVHMWIAIRIMHMEGAGYYISRTRTEIIACLKKCQCSYLNALNVYILEAFFKTVFQATFIISLVTSTAPVIRHWHALLHNPFIIYMHVYIQNYTYAYMHVILSHS